MNSYKFIQDWIQDGFSIRKGVVIRGDLIVTETTVSIKGSESFKDIPIDILEGHQDVVYAKKQKIKKTKERKQQVKKTAEESARISSRIDLLAENLLTPTENVVHSA
jgi:hypothetical protein